MTAREISSIEMAPSELGEALSAVRLCQPEAQQQMQMPGFERGVALILYARELADVLTVVLGGGSGQLDREMASAFYGLRFIT